MNRDGSDQHVLVEAASLQRSPFWSPDGTKIAYTMMRRDPVGDQFGHYVLEVWVIGVDGSNDTRLYHSPCCAGGGEYPVWSPDGSRIAFSPQIDGMSPDWIVVNADGTGSPEPIDQTEVAVVVIGTFRPRPRPCDPFVAAVVAFALAACTGSDPEPAGSSNPDTATSSPDAEVSAFGDLPPCDDDASWLCGSVSVPLDRAEPDGEQLEIAFYVQPHSDDSTPAAEPVFVTPGGPGRNVWIDGKDPIASIASLTANHDIVAVATGGRARPARSTARTSSPVSRASGSSGTTPRRAGHSSVTTPTGTAAETSRWTSTPFARRSGSRRSTTTGSRTPRSTRRRTPPASPNACTRSCWTRGSPCPTRDSRSSGGSGCRRPSSASPRSTANRTWRARPPSRRPRPTCAG